MSLHRLLRRGRGRRQRGQGLTEFALVIPIFLLLVVALFDLGRAVFAYNTLTNAAREGARIAIVNQYTPSIVTRAKSQTKIVELDDPSVSVTFWQVGSERQAGQDEAAVQLARRGRLPCRRQVRGDLPPDHPVHQQHPVRERRDLHRHVAALGRIQLSAESQCTHGRGRCRGLSEAAMNRSVSPDPTHEDTMHRTAPCRRSASPTRPDHRRRRAHDDRAHRWRLAGPRGRQRLRPSADRPERGGLRRECRGDHPRPAARRWHRGRRRRHRRDRRDGGRQPPRHATRPTTRI